MSSLPLPVAPVNAPAVTPAPAPVVKAPVALPKVAAPKLAAKPADARIVKVQAPGALDRNAIIDRVAKAMSDTKTVQGIFTQVDPSNSPSSGAFYISRPGKVRFEYTVPEPIFIVSDGTTVSIEVRRRDYDRDLAEPAAAGSPAHADIGVSSNGDGPSGQDITE